MFGKAMQYAGDYRKKTYASVAWLLGAVIAGILPYFFIYQLIRPLLGIGGMTAAGILWRIGMIAACGILYALLYVHGLTLSHDSAYHTLQNIRVCLQKKMENQPMGMIQERGVGTMKKMFIDDIETIELLMAHVIPEGLAGLAVPIGVIITMFLADWKLALLSLLALPLGMLSMGICFKLGNDKMGAYYSAAQRMNNTIVEYVNGMEVVKVFNRDGDSYRRLENDVKSYRDFTLDWYRVCWPWMALYNSILPCVALFTLPLGTWFVIQGWSELADFVLVLCMSFGIGAPLLRAMSFMGKIPQLNYKIEELEKMMQAEPLKQSDQPFAGKDHTIRFENVHFSYQEEEVLHGISLTIPEGKMTALVGESGSGKSTLARLMVHFYDASEGMVSMGGQNLQDMSLESLNDRISYVAQEQFLFHMSILENIRLGRPSATDQEVIEAAKKAQCMEFIDRLPEGIHTSAGDGGKELSGGERQRISLARAILKDAPVVVLDEATAFMDPQNEEKMNRAIAEVIRGKTVVVIAHRLYTITGADQICVLDQGNLAAVGKHEELLHSCAEYQKLWRAAEGSRNWKVSAGGEKA